MAVFEKDESNIIITGTDEADSIKSTGANVTIDADDGRDTIDNSGASVTIDAGYGVDSIVNSGTNVSINAGDSGDYISNTGGNSTLDGDAGNDTVYNAAQYVTISGGKGNDSVNNTGAFTSIDGGAGTDTVNNSAANVTISSGADNDNISNKGANTSINAGEGNDYIWTYGDNNLIDSGDGDDTVDLQNVYGYTSFHNTTVNTGAGNDYVKIYEYSSGEGRNISVNTGDGDDTVIVSRDSYLTVECENGNDSIYNAANSYDLFDGGAGSDTLYSSHGNYVTMLGGDGNDFIFNGGVMPPNGYSWDEGGSNVTIGGGNGNDSIQNWGSTVSIDAGAGDDSITSNGNVGTIGGGDGSDNITSTGNEVSIDGGADDDTISSNGNDATIGGGAGNDSIKSTGDEVLFKYAPGDGDDTIEGFNATSRLRIGDGKTDTYGTLKSGDDVIVYVGTGTILLVGAASLEELSITGVENEIPIWRLNGTTATYGTSTETLITVSGVKSLDGISLSDKTVTIATSSLNQTGVTINSGYTLALANDVSAPQPTAAHWEHSGSTATYKNDYTSAGYTLSNNQIVYSRASGGETLITVTGVKSLDGISLKDKTVTVANSALNQQTVSISNGYTLAFADDVTKTSTTAAAWSLSGTTATYKNTATTAGYKLDNNQISYVGASGGETLITVTGVKSLDGISLKDKTVTVANSALNQAAVTINSGYTLALADDVTKSTTTAAGWNLSGSTATYKNAETTTGYSLNNNQISYNKASGGETVVTVNGVKSKDGLSLSGKTVTVAASALNKAKVTISDGYTLALGTDVTKTSATAAHFDGTTYKSASNTAGYQLADNQISYVAAQVETDLFTISGVKNTSGISIDGKTVKVAASSLNQSTVTINSGYTLKLADDVTKTATTAAGWSLTNNVATYKNAKTTAGYKLDNNQISYVKASGGETLITVTGVKSADGLSLNGTTVTVDNSALNQTAVTISNGYTLKLGSDVTKTSTTAAGWTLSNNVATYKNAKTTAGYKLDNNQIVYNTASGGDTLITVNGVKSKDGLSLSGSTVTVAASALNQASVSISDGYTLKLGSDVTKSTTTAAAWSRSGDVATYKNASTSAGYSLDKNQISYNTASGGETLVTVTGIKSLDGISLSGKTVTIAKAALNQETVTVSNGYTLALDTDVTKSSTTAADWTFSDNVASYKNSSTSAGYSIVNNQIVYNAASGGETLVEVSGVKATKGLTLDGKTVKVAASSLNQKSVTVSSDYTLALENDVTTPTTTAAAWSLKDSTATYKNTSVSAGYKLSNNQITYNAASGGKTLITVEGVKSLDGIKLNGKTVKVAASALNKANVTLTGDNYKLALENDVDDPETTKAWSYKSSKATYDQTTTAGYTLASNGKSISYSDKTTKNLITVSGVKSKDGLSLSKKVVTVGAAALDKKAVTVTDGYTLKLGSNVTKQTTKKAAWSYKSGTATYKSSYKTAGYKLSANKISYAKATTASTLATVKGAKSKSGLSVSDNKITLKNSALSKKVSISGGYNFNFYKDYKSATITGSSKGDTITTNGSKLLVSGGKGNDTLKIFGTKTTVKGGAGSDVFIFKSSTGSNVISDYVAADKISVAGTAQVAASGSNIVLTAGKNKITVTGGKDKKVSYIDAGGENVYNYKTGVMTSGTTITLLKNYLKASVYVSDKLQNADASAVQLDISITGNALMNSLKGGKGNDTLTGGGSNDTLTGGDGADVFIYAKGDGNDLITDYAEEDRIKITSGTAKVKKSNKDVIFTVGSGKITVKGAADKVVTYIDAKGKTNYYPAPTKDSYIINGTAVTVLEEYKSATFDVGNVKNGSKVKRIDASPVSHDLEIIGNAQANVILGGKGDDTIYGGKGNDTLQGGEGKNIFVYKSGNDKIIDYDAGDTISLESGAVSNVSVKGSDSVITVGKNKITVVGGADKVVTIADKKGNDTIISGKGNDKLWGSTGKDTFIYESGDGKDVIYGFDNADMLKITGKFSGTANAKGTEVYFKVGSTAKAITLKNFDATSFNVNGDAYHISGKKLVK